jgi:cysteinyl-tRNA synthetase
VLEHLTDPHDAVRWIADDSRFIVASSPWDEGPWWHDECHAWAWDREGYRALIEQGGYRILNHENVGRFQIVLGVQL